MPLQSEKRWIKGALAVWIAILAVAIATAFYAHRGSPAILKFFVSTDPAPPRRALYLRLEGDRLVKQALLRHEALTSGTAHAQSASGTLVSEVAPMLARAERLYRESLDAQTSQPGVLFQLGQVNLLRGQRLGGYLYLARYWDAIGEREIASAYRRLAFDLDPSATLPVRDDAPTTGLRR